MHSSITSFRLRTALVALAALSLPSALGGCELATHFGDYQQGTPMDSSTADGSLDAGNRDAGDANDAARDANVDVGPIPDAFMLDSAMLDAAPLTHQVSVTIAGAGTGAVQAMGGTLSCDTGTCTWTVNDGATLTMHPLPGPTSALTSWGGACSARPATGDCSLTITSNVALTATFDVRHVTLTLVITNPPGSVAITGGAATVTCDGATAPPCNDIVNAGTTLTLTATPTLPNTEVAWAGAPGCSGLTCMATLNADTTITATFADARPVLSVNETGHGTVSSPDHLINCINGSGICSNIYNIGTSVTLTQVPEAGYTFGGWTGCDSMTATTCTIMLAAHQHASVMATWTINHYTMIVHMGGTAGGTVTSSSPTLTCTSAMGMCTSSGIPYNTTVTLTATPDAGAVFQSWSGVSGCVGPTCTFTVTSNVDVTATFVPDTRTIRVVVAGADGQITSAAAPFNCTYTAGTATGTCMATLNVNSTFDLSVLVRTGYHVQGWSSNPFSIGCTGSMTNCNATVVPAIPAGGGTITVTLAPTLYTLDVNAVASSGGGVVQSTVGASTTSCTATGAGNDCPTSYPYGTMVTLHAMPNAGSVFLGWGGGICAGTSDCIVTIDSAKSVTGTFSVQTTLLQVNTSGVSTGTVSSTLPTASTIQCGATCNATLAVGTMVSLTATPAANYVFTGWTGACSGMGVCNLTIVNGSNIVNATFTLVQEMLTVSTMGGTGTVTDGGGQINCGSMCVTTYGYGTNVSLTETPASGYVFVGWTGCDSTTGGLCQVSMMSARSVFATFAQATAQLTLSLAGTGTGSVTTGDGMINCHQPSIVGDSCVATYAFPSVRTLHAFPGANTTVTWSGCTPVAGMPNDCTVSMNGPTSVTAIFDLVSYTVSATPSPAALGTTRSNDSFINCPGGGCSHTYTYGSVVTLFATPNAPNVFTGWTGVPSCGASSVCTFTVTSAVNAVANFAAPVNITVNFVASPGAVGSRVFLQGMTCGQGNVASSCTFTVAPGIYTLSTSGTPAYYGAIWSGVAGCSGPTCTVNAGSSVSMSVTWAPLGNLAFITSTTYGPVFGGSAGAAQTNSSANCNARAFAAGLPGNYVAWLSFAGSPMSARIPAADSIWVRPDGHPIATTRAQLFSGVLINPPLLDEAGNVVTGNTWTGTNGDGSLLAGYNCNGWTMGAPYNAMFGTPTYTSGAWSGNTTTNCTGTNRIYCFQTGGSGFAALAPIIPADAVRIFTSSASGTGATPVSTMDSRCQSEASANSLPGTYVALVSTSTTTAFTRATLYGTLTRSDGWTIGPHNSGTSVLSTSPPPSLGVFGVGADRGLTGLPAVVWTGMGASAASSGATCTDWTTGSGVGAAGDPSSAIIGSWSGPQSNPCSESHHWYCIQNGP